ncbi:MAG: tRNA (adenosine(37)-N6)-dimethylallyltransferase MiaA [Candidatus Eisenbacteria bacterium]|nr:tRNA (adenosine(37)-N6)-dimethylallyltransferase MiaA [Candidatus Eisenbacteria bacterium]
MTSTGDSAEAADRLPPVVVLLGTTASGKTAVSLPLARLLGAEIVALDSKQVLAKMAIGTAQPTVAEQAIVRHHLVGVADPRDRFSAGDYGRLARGTLADIEARGGRALFVGGSGLYLEAFLGRLAESLPHDLVVRESLRDRVALEGSAALHAELTRLDPDCAARLHPNDAQRITRALEVIQLTGATMSGLQASQSGAHPELAARTQMILLDRPRDEVYARIERRTEELLAGGMIEEASELLATGIDPASPAFRAHGYPEIARYLNGSIDRLELTRALNQVTRNYAKRQMTWFRRLPGLLRVPTTGDISPEETARLMASRLEDIT